MSSKPVSQLAAVFSQPSIAVQQSQFLPLVVHLPQEPVPASELGMTLPSDFNHRKTLDKNDGQHQNLGPSYELPISKLPATLPPPQHTFVKEEVEEDNMIQDPNDIIKQQQLQIEELKQALQRSNEQLLTQKTSMKCESKPSQHFEIIQPNIQQKSTEQTRAISCKPTEQGEALKTPQVLDYVQSSSMEDVIDILMKNGGKHQFFSPVFSLRILIQICQRG
jgi:hypothetical protein